MTMASQARKFSCFTLAESATLTRLAASARRPSQLHSSAANSRFSASSDKEGDGCRRDRTLQHSPQVILLLHRTSSRPRDLCQIFGGVTNMRHFAPCRSVSLQTGQAQMTCNLTQHVAHSRRLDISSESDAAALTASGWSANNICASRPPHLATFHSRHLARLHHPKSALHAVASSTLLTIEYELRKLLSWTPAA